MIASLLEFNWLANPQDWGALFTLTMLEIVLGIDNIVFISILVDRLPAEKRRQGRLMASGWRWVRGWFCYYRSLGS